MHTGEMVSVSTEKYFFQELMEGVSPEFGRCPRFFDKGLRCEVNMERNFFPLHNGFVKDGI